MFNKIINKTMTCLFEICKLFLLSRRSFYKYIFGQGNDNLHIKLGISVSYSLSIRFFTYKLSQKLPSLKMHRSAHKLALLNEALERLWKGAII